MKRDTILFVFLVVLVTASPLVSCKKDDSKMDYGFSQVYMPQAIAQSGGVNNNYPVPSGTDSTTYNYYLNTSDNKINVILGTSLSGPGRGAYSVDIKVDNDTIQQLFTTKVLDTSLYKLMPASMYTIPAKLAVSESAKSGTFDLAIDIAQIKSNTYTGKYLVLAVKVTNPTTYTLNSALATTVIIVDVNALVIGPAINVTSKYILNPGNPFISSVMNGSRWGSLKDWKANPAALSHGGVGGYGKDGDGQTIDLESGWGSDQILNGKVFQTLNLPAGTYSFDPSGGTWKWQGTKEAAYAVIAAGMDTLPDFNKVTSTASVMYQVIAQPQPLVTFQLTASSKVTVGFVVNYIQTEQGIKTTQVALYNYPKHL